MLNIASVNSSSIQLNTTAVPLTLRSRLTELSGVRDFSVYIYSRQSPRPQGPSPQLLVRETTNKTLDHDDYTNNGVCG